MIRAAARIALVALFTVGACAEVPPPPIAMPVAPPVAKPYVPPRYHTQRDLAGHWVETFDSRGGCSDMIAIVRSAAGYVASGNDCNDNAPYDFGDLTYDGDGIAVQINVPQTGYSVRYELRWESADELVGVAEVVGPSSSEHHDVRWTRER
jgi:hypothetical protein